MTRNRVAVVALLAFLGAGLSGLLLFEHYGVGPASETVHELCGPESESGCELVSRSAYSSLGPFSLAGIGVVFYASILLLLGLGLVAPDGVREAIAGFALLLFGAALLVDVVLFGIQAFRIGAFCRLCLATYAVNAASLAALFPARAKLGALLREGGEGRRSFAVWGMGTFVILVGTFAVEGALASVRAGERANLLGRPEATRPEAPPAPVAEPTTTTTTTTSSTPEPAAASAPPVAPEDSAGDSQETARLQAALEAAEARARELQATLDDPQKYQDYQAKKAAEEFERETPVDLGLEGIPFKGPAEAPIKVVEFSDFLCPFCRNLAGAFGGYLPQSQGRVAIYYKNYPLDQACNPRMTRTVHDGACELALGGICAHEQGRFWPYHDRIFSQPPSNPTNDDVVRFATEAGLDGEAMRQCLESSAARAKLDREIEEGRRVQVNATPTVFVNGKRLQQIGGFLQAIELEMKRLGIPSASP